MKKKFLKQQGGFTIIEITTAIAIFVVVVVMGIGALLNANNLHRKTQRVRSIMDNLSFIMEDMSRNIRTGENFNCSLDDGPNISPDCSNGKRFTFVNSNLPGNWIYTFFDDGIYKDTGTGDIKISPDDVTFDGNSGFTVAGADEYTPGGDIRQPYVIIRFSGTINYKNQTVTDFSLETSVSQRLVDI